MRLIYRMKLLLFVLFWPVFALLVVLCAAVANLYDRVMEAWREE